MKICERPMRAEGKHEPCEGLLIRAYWRDETW